MTEPTQQWPGTPVFGRAPSRADRDRPQRPAENWPGTPVFVNPRRDDVTAQSIDKPIVYDRTRLPRTAAIAAGSFPTDPNARIRIFAADLFPSMEIGAASRRFGLSGGRIYYVGADGKNYWAEPQLSANPSDVANWVASGVGAALPFVGGAVGGLGSGPGSIVASGVGAAAGDVARQVGAQAVTPEGPPGTPPVEYDPWQTVGEAATAGVGQAVGLGLGRALTRNPVGITPIDRSNARLVARSGSADAAQAEATAHGVPLSFGQATNLRSARETERALAADPSTADVMQAFYENQRQSLRSAVLRDLDKISANPSDVGAASFRTAAGEVGDTVRRTANAQARPFYQAAESQTVPLAGFAPENLPVIGNAMNAVRNDPLIGNSLRGFPDDSVKFLDQVRRHLDDQIGAALRAGENNRARLLRDARADVQDALLTNQNYRAALDAARPGQQAAARIEESGAARVSNAAPDAPARQITSPLFDYRRVSPAGIAQARADFVAAGKTEEWNDGLRAFLESTLDMSSRGIAGGASAVRLRFELWADPRARAAMKAAMDGPQFASFERLMQVVEHVARTLPENSATANKLMSAEAVNAMARGPMAKSIQFVGSVLSPMRLADAPGAVADRLTWGLTQRGKEALAAAVTDPRNLEALRRLRMLSPNSQAAIGIASQLLTRVGTGAAAGAVFRPGDAEPNP